MANGFRVLTDALVRGAGSIEGDGNDVASAGSRGAEGATTAAGGAGTGPLAGALETLADELTRASGTVRDAFHAGGDSLRASANTYAQADQGVTATMDAFNP